MEFIVEEVVSPQDLAKHRQQYEKEKEALGKVSSETQFDYAWCLVRTTTKDSVRQGCQLLEELYHKTKDEKAKRDYIFYIAIGFTRLADYDKALKFANALLEFEPSNHQAKDLVAYIEKKRKKDAMIGVAVLGGIGGAAAIAIGGLIGFALSKK